MHPFFVNGGTTVAVPTSRGTDVAVPTSRGTLSFQLHTTLRIKFYNSNTTYYKEAIQCKNPSSSRVPALASTACHCHWHWPAGGHAWPVAVTFYDHGSHHWHELCVLRLVAGSSLDVVSRECVCVQRHCSRASGSGSADSEPQAAARYSARRQPTVSPLCGCR